MKRFEGRWLESKAGEVTRSLVLSILLQEKPPPASPDAARNSIYSCLSAWTLGTMYPANATASANHLLLHKKEREDDPGA